MLLVIGNMDFGILRYNIVFRGTRCCRVHHLEITITKIHDALILIPSAKCGIVFWRHSINSYDFCFQPKVYGDQIRHRQPIELWWCCLVL